MLEYDLIGTEEKPEPSSHTPPPHSGNLPSTSLTPHNTTHTTPHTRFFNIVMNLRQDRTQRFYAAYAESMGALGKISQYNRGLESELTGAVYNISQEQSWTAMKDLQTTSRSFITLSFDSRPKLAHTLSRPGFYLCWKLTSRWYTKTAISSNALIWWATPYLRARCTENASNRSILIKLLWLPVAIISSYIIGLRQIDVYSLIERDKVTGQTIATIFQLRIPSEINKPNIWSRSGGWFPLTKLDLTYSPNVCGAIETTIISSHH